jgi:small-conductance mechanosensitive channel
MLTKNEEDFIRYWEVQRTKKRQFLRKTSIGLPLAVVIVVALMVNFLSGWYEKADQMIHQNTSVIIVVLIAVIGIVVFITVFSARHKWEQNELYYEELMAKKQKQEAAGS